MAKKENTPTGLSAEDRALTTFADLVINKLETLQQDWKQPWFSPNMAQVPQNLSGRRYNGANSIILMLQQEKNGWQTGRYATFDRLAAMNFTKQKDGTRTPTLDANGQKLPMVVINKGERSTPVMLTTFTVVDKDTKERIKYDDYKNLSQDERAQYNVYPRQTVFNVFNIDQTNMKESRPEMYQQFLDEARGHHAELGDKPSSFPVLDAMIEKDLYVCPIKPTLGDNAYYSISRDEIVIPKKEQFKDGNSFYSNVLHEMSHASGAENRLDRLKPGSSFGSKEYSREELVAEMTAALISNEHGMEKQVKNDSLPYLKSWLDSLHEDPSYIRTVLNDVKRSASFISTRMDNVKEVLDRDGWEANFDEVRTMNKDQSQTIHEGNGEEIAAKAPQLTNDEIINKIDSFMQQYYFAARRDNGFRMMGITEHEGKPAIKLNSDAAIGTSHYVITHEQDAQRKDQFYLHLVDNGEEIFKSRAMPHDRDDAYSFLRGAAREQTDYAYEKAMSEKSRNEAESNEQSQNETQNQEKAQEQEKQQKHTFHRGR